MPKTTVPSSPATKTRITKLFRGEDQSNEIGHVLPIEHPKSEGLDRILFPTEYQQWKGGFSPSPEMKALIQSKRPYLKPESETTPVANRGFFLPKWEPPLPPIPEGGQKAKKKKRLPPQKEQRLILIKGEPGTGKSILCAQMIAHFLSALPDDRFIRYIATNENRYGLEGNLRDFFGIDISKDFSAQESTSTHKINRQGSPAILEIQSKRNDWYPEIFSDDLFKTIKLNQKSKDELAPAAVFIDSMNLINSRFSHAALRDFLLDCTKRTCLTFIVIEDYGDRHNEHSKLLAAQAEFLVDTIISLGSEMRQGYFTYTIQVPKMHYGKQTLGKHHYGIGIREKHPTSHIEPERSGLIVYPSMHYYFSKSSVDTFTLENNFVHTGIQWLDGNIKPMGRPKDEKEPTTDIIPADSMFVVQGDPDAHMMPIGLSLLCGGMIKMEGNSKIQPDRDVLLISLSEEGNYDLLHESLAGGDSNKKGNIGNYIEWRFHNATFSRSTYREIEPKNPYENLIGQCIDGYGNVTLSSITEKDDTFDYNKIITNYDNTIGKIHTNQHLRNILLATKYGPDHFRCRKSPDRCSCKDKSKNSEGHCHLEELFARFGEVSKNFGKKVLVNKWCAYIHDKPFPESERKENHCRKVIVLSFRPGSITPEQFIQLVERILMDGNFSRVLFDSTALIPSRFPLLEKEGLFLPALIRLFKSKSLVSIFLTPTSEGSNKKLNFELENMADFAIKVQAPQENPRESNNSSEAIVEVKDYRNRNHSSKFAKFKVSDSPDFKKMISLSQNTTVSSPIPSYIQSFAEELGFITNDRVIAIPNESFAEALVNRAIASENPDNLSDDLRKNLTLIPKANHAKYITKHLITYLLKKKAGTQIFTFEDAH